MEECKLRASTFEKPTLSSSVVHLTLMLSLLSSRTTNSTLPTLPLKETALTTSFILRKICMVSIKLETTGSTDSRSLFVVSPRAQ
jgi:hypothetical protein